MRFSLTKNADIPNDNGAMGYISGFVALVSTLPILQVCRVLLWKPGMIIVAIAISGIHVKLRIGNFWTNNNVSIHYNVMSPMSVVYVGHGCYPASPNQNTYTNYFYPKFC